MKVSGALWDQFYNDEEWWKGYCHDDTLILFDGVEVEEYDKPPPGAVVKIESGYAYREEGDLENWRNTSVPLTSFFQKWKKKQNTLFLVVHVDKDYLESAKAEIKKLDGVKKVV